MQIWRFGVAAGLLAGLGACSNMMGGGGTAASRPVAATQPVTQPTMAPVMVKDVQSRLRDDGYYKLGSLDGIWGSRTESAVRSFQKDHNLATSGQLDVPTLQALNLTSPPGGNADTAPPPPPTQPSGAVGTQPGNRPAASDQAPPAH